MNMTKNRANEILVTDPKYCDTQSIKRIIFELSSRECPMKEETRQDLLWEFKFELNKRK